MSTSQAASCLWHWCAAPYPRPRSPASCRPSTWRSRSNTPNTGRPRSTSYRARSPTPSARPNSRLGPQQARWRCSTTTPTLGTPRELTDRSGHIAWAATYKAWGNTTKIEHPPRLVASADGNTLSQHWAEQAEPVEQNLRFQGQYFDGETGLHYNRFRYYDPDCGRFVSQDPIRLRGGIHLYRYSSNPTGFVDPWGLEAVAYQMKGNVLCIRDKFPVDSAESKELGEFIDRWNKQIEINGGSMARRILTPEEEAESRRWKRGKRCECPPGTVAGHVPDAAAGGPATPRDWMAQMSSTNSYVDGIVSKLPVGYTYETVKMVTALGDC